MVLEKNQSKMTFDLKWGILGAGNISSQFVHDLCLNNERKEGSVRHIITSIGTSSSQKGSEFLEKCGISSKNNEGIVPAVQSYEDLFKNKDVKVVYIGTPHPMHKSQVEQALNSGKHVLCEKPFTVNKEDAEYLVNLARSKELFLMEAVWTRFFPAIESLKKLLFETKKLGTIHRLFADFSYDAELAKLPPTSRLRDINLAGGTLLDIGIYSLTYGRILLDNKLGKENSKFQVKSFLTLDPTDKVDYNSTVIMKYANGSQGILTASNYTDGPSPFARLECSNGYVEIFAHNPASPEKIKVVFKDGSEPVEYENNTGYNGFIYEANAVAHDIQAGRTENAIMPLDETLLVMSTMDGVRKENGFVYPHDH